MSLIKSLQNLDIDDHALNMQRGSSMMVMEDISARGARSKRSNRSSSGDDKNTQRG
jgi:hypothetical protein